MRRLLSLGLLSLMAGCGPPPTEPVRGTLSRVADGIEFTAVRQVEVQDSLLWILDESQPFITRVHTGSGDVLRWGVRGSGPGEVLSPSAMVLAPGSVSLIDFEVGVRVAYAMDGRHLGTSALSDERSGWIRPNFHRVSHLRPTRVRAFGSEYLYAHLPEGATHPIDVASAALVRAGPDLAPIAELLRFDGHVARDRSATGQFPAVPLWDACGENEAVVWLPHPGEVAWLDAQGGVRRSQPIQASPFVVSIEHVERYLAEMARLEMGSVNLEALDLPARAREVRSVVGRDATPFSDIRCDDERRAWLRRFDLSDSPLGASSRWVVVGPNGATSSAHLPGDFEPAAFAAGGIVGVERGLDGDVLSMWRTN